MSAESKELAAQVVDEWAPLGAVRSKAMFGGHGIFIDGEMFAMVDSKGQLLLKADDTTARELGSAGSEKHGRMPYWTVPDEVADDEDRLLGLARRAADLART